MKIKGMYRIVDAPLGMIWRELRNGTNAFQDRFAQQLTLISEAASLFPVYQSRLYTVRQFVTDHPESRYLPSWLVKETINLTAKGLVMTDADAPHGHNPVFVDGKGERHIPSQPALDADTIDAGCVRITRHKAGIAIEGDIPDSKISMFNGFWAMVSQVLEEGLSGGARHDEGGSVAYVDGKGEEHRVLAFGNRHVHEQSEPVSKPQASADPAATSVPSQQPKRSGLSDLPPAQVVIPMICAIDDQGCEACQ